MSKHQALVVPVKLEKHPNADSLSVVNIGGFTICVNSSNWIGKDKGIYITPETIVDCSRPEFSFLGDGKKKIAVKRLRGVYSQGLLIPAPDDANIGEDLFFELGLEHYEPEFSYTTGGDFIKPPSLFGDMIKYDVENLRKPEVLAEFIKGEPVFVTRKLNGSNIAVAYTDNTFFVRSRSGFRKEGDNIFWNCITEEVIEFCKSNPDTFLYGESVGHVKNFKYDCKDGKVSFRVFDVMTKDRKFLDVDKKLDIYSRYGLTSVPIVGTIPFDIDELIKIAEEPCPLGNKISEGIVVNVMKERWSYNIGRVSGKIVSCQYLEKN